MVNELKQIAIYLMADGARIHWVAALFSNEKQPFLAQFLLSPDRFSGIFKM
jgi:hypothetical protein